jgi:hypothetical protein
MERASIDITRFSAWQSSGRYGIEAAFRLALENPLHTELGRTLASLLNKFLDGGGISIKRRVLTAGITGFLRPLLPHEPLRRLDAARIDGVLGVLELVDDPVEVLAREYRSLLTSSVLKSAHLHHQAFQKML